MPFFTRDVRIESWEPFDSSHQMGDSGVLTDVGLTADTYGHKILKPGTVLAKITGSSFATYGKLIAKVATPSYGPGSNVAKGLLRNYVDLANGDLVVAFVTHGRVRESLVTDQGTTGTVQAATKTSLPLIEWI